MPLVTGDVSRTENQQVSFPVVSHDDGDEALTLIRCGGLGYDSGSLNIMSA